MLTMKMKTLLGAVAETTSLLGPRGARDTVNGGELAVVPAANALQVAHNLALLLAPDLLHILVCTHVLQYSS